MPVRSCRDSWLQLLRCRPTLPSMLTAAIKKRLVIQSMTGRISHSIFRLDAITSVNLHVRPALHLRPVAMGQAATAVDVVDLVDADANLGVKLRQESTSRPESPATPIKHLRVRLVSTKQAGARSDGKFSLPRCPMLFVVCSTEMVVVACYRPLFDATACTDRAGRSRARRWDKGRGWVRARAKLGATVRASVRISRQHYPHAEASSVTTLLLLLSCCALPAGVLFMM